MKRWVECRTESERRDAYNVAVEVCGASMAGVAAVLGVKRQHAYRLRDRYAPKEAAPEAGDERTARVLLDLPRRCVDWLEREALRRKQEQGRSRMAKSPIVVELIDEAMRRGAP